MSESPRAAHAPPRSTDEALQRARLHARSALRESLLAGRALLDAAALATAGVDAAGHPALGSIAGSLDQLADTALRGSVGELPLLGALRSALDAEIARWEQRARDDRDARSVLRAFMGLREILWELGIRPDPQEAASDTGAGAAAPKRARTPRSRKPRRSPERAPRVQRVEVQG